MAKKQQVSSPRTAQDGARGRTSIEPEEESTDRRGDAADGSSVRKDGASDGGQRPREIGGRKGPEPTRYGDWEKNGRCIDF